MGYFVSVYSLYVKNHINWLEKYLKKPSSWFDYAPGENVFYASIDINILGYVIENITGQTYSDYCQEHIFKPLNMTNTSFYLSDFNIAQLVRQYVWLKVIYIQVPIMKITKSMFPAGGIRSNIDDMSHFLIMHTNGGIYNGVRILNESSVEEMHRAQYPESLDEGHNHGLGWYFMNYSDGEIYGGHDGVHLGTYTVMKMRYSDEVGILFFYNQHSYILGFLHNTPDIEKEARKGIREALFEKAEEF